MNLPTRAEIEAGLKVGRTLITYLSHLFLAACLRTAQLLALACQQHSRFSPCTFEAPGWFMFKQRGRYWNQRGAEHEKDSDFGCDAAPCCATDV
jgi:hypothetical protein